MPDIYVEGKVKPDMPGAFVADAVDIATRSGRNLEEELARAGMGVGGGGLNL